MICFNRIRLHFYVRKFQNHALRQSLMHLKSGSLNEFQMISQLYLKV